jgi:hypothetical protein
MGAFLLGAGTKGKRRSLPNSRIMIHQPLGGAQGQATDIEIQAKEILFIRALLCEYIADYTGQPVEKVEDDCDRDFFMTPEEAKARALRLMEDEYTRARAEGLRLAELLERNEAVWSAKFESFGRAVAEEAKGQAAAELQRFKEDFVEVR